MSAPVETPRSEVETSAPGRDRIQRVSVAVLVALGLAFGLAVQAAAGIGSGAAPSDARLGGDFPAFYAAGSIALDGDWDQLYSSERQAAEQHDLGLEGFLAFAYPPHVALGLIPFAAVGFRAGYALHTLLMVGATVGALWILRPLCRPLRVWFLPATAAALAFYPLFRAVSGGQNAALTLLLFAVVWRSLADDNEILAGVAVGLLLYRPQYALPLMGLLLLGGRWRALASATAVSAVTWAISAATFGGDWVTRWLDEVGPFVETDAVVNAPNSISVLGFVQALVDSRSTSTYVVAALVVLPVVAVLMWRWAALGSQPPLAAQMGLVALGGLLISPHTMFYDAGLLVLAVTAAIALHESESIRLPVSGLRLATIVWIGGLLHPIAQSVDAPATPLAIVVLGAFVAMEILLRQGQGAEVVAIAADGTETPAHGKAA